MTQIFLSYACADGANAAARLRTELNRGEFMWGEFMVLRLISTILNHKGHYLSSSSVLVYLDAQASCLGLCAD